MPTSLGGTKPAPLAHRGHNDVGHNCRGHNYVGHNHIGHNYLGTSLSFSSSSGETARLNDVLFGDVFLCGGQSNMRFALGGALNAAAEADAAERYARIRLFTVGQRGYRSRTPLASLPDVDHHWLVASADTVARGGTWGVFSAVCWFFGRRVADANPSVPIGLVSNSRGASRIEEWLPVGSTRCGGHERGALYNSQIAPYSVGPMALAGFIWYQGEANTKDAASARRYACLFPALIEAWRAQFRAADRYFGFVQLSTWCATPAASIAEMRDAQMAALRLRQVGYATAADHGDGCDIHPRNKKPVGVRLGNSALALVYGHGAGLAIST